jgi:hypothetical protein
MSEAPDSRNFVHRTNRDGTVDSICVHCFRTIANEKIEAALKQGERDHLCPAIDREPAGEPLRKKDVRKFAEFPSRDGFKAG